VRLGKRRTPASHGVFLGGAEGGVAMKSGGKVGGEQRQNPGENGKSETESNPSFKPSLLLPPSSLRR